MKNLAIITARGGSKRIPQKNIKHFMGKPMLAYAVEAALNAGIFDEVMVSTDDLQIANIAKQYNAKVPFMRSQETSNDFATTHDVLVEVMDSYKSIGQEFDNICCIYPCVPFLTPDILKDAFDKFLQSKADRLTPVVKYSFPIQRAFVINENGFLAFREPENQSTRSQDLQPTYHDVGMFYFYKSDRLNSNKISSYEMDERVVQDIDTMDDWKMAEMKYKVMHDV